MKNKTGVMRLRTSGRYDIECCLSTLIIMTLILQLTSQVLSVTYVSHLVWETQPSVTFVQ